MQICCSQHDYNYSMHPLMTCMYLAHPWTIWQAVQRHVDGPCRQPTLIQLQQPLIVLHAQRPLVMRHLGMKGGCQWSMIEQLRLLPVSGICT